MATIRKGRLAAMLFGGVGLAILAFVVCIFLVKWLWGWTVPDLFPLAVERGYVAGSISWFTAMKLALFFAVLAGITRATLHVNRRQSGSVDTV
jgi:hypothetical protein